jgi:serine/threonine protein kinase
VLGSPSEAEYKKYSEKVPFDSNLFAQFPKVHKTKKDLARLFYNFTDAESLLDLLYKMFEYLPENRITAANALQHQFFDEIREDYGILMESEPQN